MRLSVLELGVTFGEKSPSDALEEARELAVTADRLGYHRFWLAEHHEAHYAWASPEIMVADLTPRTKRIRLGSAAVLLCLYNPRKISEVFHNLGLLHPGRIDLGVCAGVPEDPRLLAALTESDEAAEPRRLSSTYPLKVERLLDQLEPPGETVPEVWLQGSGIGNVILSARHGTFFSYSQFHRGSARDPALIRRYRDEFTADGRYAEPACNIAVSVICAERAEEAERQRQRIEQLIGGDMSINLHGTPSHCAEGLTELAERFSVDEIVVHAMWDTPRPRIDSYVMLAEALSLPVLATVD